VKRKQIVLAVAILLIANLLMVPQAASAQSLAPPTQEFPANGATGVPRSPTLVWIAAEGADSYWVKIVGCGNEFTVEGTSITIPEENLSACYSDHFFWSVQARNPAGLSEPSETWTFTRVPR
jgi:hypothetical protein